MIQDERNKVIETLNNLHIHSDESYQELQMVYISQLKFDINTEEWFDKLKQQYCQIQITLSPFRIFKLRQLRLGNLNLQNDSQQLLTNQLKSLILSNIEQIIITIEKTFNFEYSNPQSYIFQLIELIANLNQKVIYVICKENQIRFEFQKTNMLAIEYNEIRTILEKYYTFHLSKDDPIQIVKEQEYVQQIYDDTSLRNDILIIINDIIFEDLQKWRTIIENIDFNDQNKSLSLLKLVTNFQQNHSPSKGGNQLYFKFYEKFKSFLINYIQQQLGQFVQNKSIIQSSNEILEFLQQTSQCIQGKYPISDKFQNIVFNSIQQVMQNQQYKNIVLVYMDKCIMEQNQKILQQLSLVIQIFQNDQSFFQQLYLNYQSKFINSVLPTVSDLDHQILKYIEEKVNNTYIQLLKQIYRDVLISNQIDNSFILLIPQNQWNIAEKQQLLLDFGIPYNQALLQNFALKHQNKLLSINDQFSKASITYRPSRNRRGIEIHLYGTQLAILWQFKNCDQKNYDELLKNSQLDTESFNLELAFLIKKGLIIKNQDIISVNQEFQSKQKINLMQKRFIKSQNEQVQNDGDLTQRIQALIIKTVKQNKNGIHFMDLKQFINQQIKFNDLKNVLENLIDLNYIERDKNDGYLSRL